MIENTKLGGDDKTMATISFIMGGMYFEYDEEKNLKNIKNHGIYSRLISARLATDYERSVYYGKY